jgi:hypothetical protein
MWRLRLDSPMRVRIRLACGPLVQRNREINLRLLPALAGLMAPGALMAAALAIWGLAADINWTADFPISSGPFALWQTWFATAAVLQLTSMVLGRSTRARVGLNSRLGARGAGFSDLRTEARGGSRSFHTRGRSPV